MSEKKTITFEHNPIYPYDSTVGKYHTMAPPYMQPWEYNGWKKESMSSKMTCNIFAQYNQNFSCHLYGPDVIKLLSDVTTNSFARFNIGRCKHTVITDEQGRVLTHGVAMRVSEEEVWTNTIAPWLEYAARKGNYNVRFEDYTLKEFNFQCSGPRSLEMLEAATGDDLHDIPFMGHRMSSIKGKEVLIVRMAMSGTLGYEVHGNTADAIEIYQTLYDAGKQFGVERLGWLGQGCNHCENGFPQEAYHFKSASIEDAGFIDYLKELGVDTNEWPLGGVYLGSSGTDLKKRFRNPAELGWHNSISFDHEFPGKAVLQELIKNPKRTTVHLIWNLEDINDVFLSYFQKNQEPYKFLDFPVEDIALTSGGGIALHQDDVFDKDGNLIGYSSGREYSLYTRDMFSMGCIDIGQADLENEVYVLWGDPGTRQKKIRATVAKFPHFDLIPNSKFDVEIIPHINRK